MIDYDAEAERYDAARGGEARAAAAASAVEMLLPAGVRVLADVACGTGIVTTRLRRSGRRVVAVDRSTGMAARATGRLRGDVLLADATALPLRAARVDAVVMIWLLHLVPRPERILAEAARVLGAGGTLITTVDKDGAPFHASSDTAELLRPLWQRYRHHADGLDRTVASAARLGLRAVGEADFTGHGQGRGPGRWISGIRQGVIPWVRPTEYADLCRALATLPEQDVPRPDPVYRVAAFRRI